MKTCLAIGLSVLILVGRSPAAPASQPVLDVAQINHAAAQTSGLLLGADDRIRAVNTFLKLVQIKGASGEEQAIRTEVKRMLMLSGATELPSNVGDSNAPLNLVMEIPASGALTNLPGILLNAHLDTVAWSTPEHLVFDPATGDFSHKDETARGQTSSFGGDDRSGVAVLVEAVRLLHAEYWRRGIGHRRIVLVLTAYEERGCLGAKFLSRHQPELFANLDVTLSMDGPLDFRSNYPQELLVAVVLEKDSAIPPYKRVLELMRDFCDRTKMRFGRTEIGLGMGDFAHFPASTRAGLHLRSPVRGFHNRERVNVRDLINHVDLMCFLLLGWDQSLPQKISPETMSPAPVRANN